MHALMSSRFISCRGDHSDRTFTVDSKHLLHVGQNLDSSDRWMLNALDSCVLIFHCTAIEPTLS